jgi:hypothetical protein
MLLMMMMLLLLVVVAVIAAEFDFPPLIIIGQRSMSDASFG